MLKKFQSRRPKWVDRREYLKPELQNLFTMSYFSEPGMLVPTSWSGVTDVKEYPRIDTRISESSSRSQGIRTPGSLSNGAASDNDSSQEEPATPAEASDVTRMADESGDEDLPAVKVRMAPLCWHVILGAFLARLLPGMSSPWQQSV